jgi:hypothetical protein
MNSLLVLTWSCSAVSPAFAQYNPPTAPRRAPEPPGWDYMRRSHGTRPPRPSRQRIDIDPTFEVPYYGLGRADLALKQYVAAIAALAKCRELYQAQVGRQFANAQEAQRYRQDRITEIDEQIRQVNRCRLHYSSRTSSAS